VVIERQAAVAELRPRLDLREELALLGEEVRDRTHPEKLIAWAEAPRVLTGGPARIAATVLSLAMLAAACYWMLEETAPARAALLGMLAVNSAFGWHFRKRVLSVIVHADEAASD